jgi:hypothetical protein
MSMEGVKSQRLNVKYFVRFGNVDLNAKGERTMDEKKLREFLSEASVRVRLIFSDGSELRIYPPLPNGEPGEVSVTGVPGSEKMDGLAAKAKLQILGPIWG